MPTVEETNPARRPLTLADWRFCYGLPVSPREYAASEANGGFATAAGFQSWEHHAQALAEAKATLDPLVAAGLQVVWGPPAWVFLGMLRRQRAVILLTHAGKPAAATERALEFSGAMEPFFRVARGVSPRFAGILEICACESDGIQPMIKRRAPGCVTKVAAAKLTLSLWVKYYAAFLRIFAEAQTTYFDAVMKMQPRNWM